MKNVNFEAVVIATALFAVITAVMLIIFFVREDGIRDDNREEKVQIACIKAGGDWHVDGYNGCNMADTR